MFVNLTKHVIRIKGRSTETRQEEIREVQPSGQVATCRPLMGESQAQSLDQFEFYTSSRSLGEVLLSSGQPFPEPAEGTIYLVSSMVQEAMPRKDVQAPDTGPTAIRDAQGNVWAVVGLIGPA